MIKSAKFKTSFNLSNYLTKPDIMTKIVVPILRPHKFIQVFEERGGLSSKDLTISLVPDSRYFDRQIKPASLEKSLKDTEDNVNEIIFFRDDCYQKRKEIPTSSSDTHNSTYLIYDTNANFFRISFYIGNDRILFEAPSGNKRRLDRLEYFIMPTFTPKEDFPAINVKLSLSNPRISSKFLPQFYNKICEYYARKGK